MKPSSGNGFETIKNIWEKSITFDSFEKDYSIDAIDGGVKLSNPDYSFTGALNGMALANALLSTTGTYSYIEADEYTTYNSSDAGRIFRKDQDVSTYTNGYTYNFTTGTLMRYAMHYIKLTFLPNSTNVLFEPYTITTSFQVNAISYSSAIPTIYAIDIGTTTSLNFNSAPDSVIFTILVDENSPEDENFYKISLTNTALSINKELIPDKYSISNIYPNPFNPSTTILFSIPEYGFTTINIFDNNGRKLETVANKFLNAGDFSIIWNAFDYPSGIYLIRMECGMFAQTQKMVLIK